MFASLFYSRQKHQPRKSHPASVVYRPTLDVLEDRCLMAGGLAATLSASGTLQVEGTKQADLIAITNADGFIAIDQAMIKYKGKLVDQVAAAAVKKITVKAGDGADHIQFLNVTLPGKAVSVDGGKGNDRILGSGGADALLGGDGDDYLDGGDGNDQLSGGKGADELHGGAGADDLRGGAGADRLLGGDGDDLLKGEDGDDNLDGGAGNNRVDGGRGNNTGPGPGPSPVFDFDFARWEQDGCQASDVIMGRGGAETCGLNSALAAAANRGLNPAANIRRLGLSQRYMVTLYVPSWYEGGPNERRDIEVEFDGTVFAWDAQPSRTPQLKLEFWTVVWQRAYLQAWGIDWRTEPGTWAAGNWISVQAGLTAVMGADPSEVPEFEISFGRSAQTLPSLQAWFISQAAHGSLLVAFTLPSAAQFGYVNNHAYTVIDFDFETVTVRNPWGKWNLDPNEPNQAATRTISWYEFCGMFYGCFAMGGHDAPLG